MSTMHNLYILSSGKCLSRIVWNLAIFACAFLLTVSNQATAGGYTIATVSDPRPLEKLATKELVRYLYLVSADLKKNSILTNTDMFRHR